MGNVGSTEENPRGKLMGPGLPSLSLGPYKFHDIYETNTHELKGSIGYHKFINRSSFTPGANAGTLRASCRLAGRKLQHLLPH